MGVKFARDYELILKDLAEAVGEIEEIYEFIGMEKSEWKNLKQEQQKGCIETLADDLFYALGEEPAFNVGQGYVQYDNARHVIKVRSGENKISIVKLT